MVGTSIGAGDRARALRTAWIGAATVGLIAEVIGLAAALHPSGWMTFFSADAAVIEQGSQYLRIVGPFYGFFGAGMALYFASQGAGRLGWPLIAALVRLAIATGGGALALRLSAGSIGVFAALGIALAVFGLINAAAVFAGAWFRKRD